MNKELMKKIPISELETLSNKYDYEQIIILGLKKSTTKLNWCDGWIATFNKDKKKCKFLGKIAEILAYNFRGFYFNKKTTEEYYKKTMDAIIKESKK